MKFLALLSSTPFESEQILASMKNVVKMEIAGKRAYTGRLSGQDAVLFNTGVGKVNAAHSATCVIEKFPVKNIICIGVGGAYQGSGLELGDIALSSKEVYGDEGVISPEGWKGLTEIGVPLARTGGRCFFNEFLPDKKLIKTALKVLTPCLPKIKAGSFITVSSVSGTIKRAGELGKRFSAICENMEGAAIAHVCTIYRIPFLEIRGVSNIAGVRDKRKWNLKLASDNCQAAVLEIINNAFRYNNR